MNASTFNRQSSSGDDQPSILIFGASARAAAQSAARAGLNPLAADLFGDVDLHETAHVFPLHQYPDDVIRVAQDAPAAAWMYTGGIENFPDLVSRVSDNRSLWGNPAEVLRRVRDPFVLYDALAHAQLPVAEIRGSQSPPPPDSEWLLKPMAGAGGSGITIWNRDAATHQTLDNPHYFQRQLEGTPVSAVFLATGGQIHHIGTTRQYVGTKSLFASPFSYCGSLGPCSSTPAQHAEITGVGQFLGERFRLRGLFGIDLLLKDQVAVPIEVNPRYVASVEVLERAFDVPLLGWHRDACDPSGPRGATGRLDQLIKAELDRIRQQCRQIVAKAILFAQHDLVWPAAKPIRDTVSRTGCQLADIPQPGSRIECGRPICTVLAYGNEELSPLRRLVRSIHRVKRFISAHRCS